MILQIGTSAYCQASCVHCLRNEITADFVPAYLRPEILRDFFPCERVEGLDLCGNFGDSLITPDFEALFGILDIFRGVRTTINTVAQGGSKSVWERLASYQNIEIRFALESLSAYHHAKNRRGTSLSRALNNAKWYIGAGGNAVWYMILFEHNEHELDKCMRYARHAGFRRFLARTSNRFFDYSTGKWLEEREGVRPAKTFPSPSIPDLSPCSVNCMFPKWVHVDEWGHVFPCCYTVSVPGAVNPLGNEEMTRCLDKYGIFSLRLGPRSYDEIVSSPLFREFMATVRKNPQLRCRACCGENPCLSLLIKDVEL